MQGSSTVTIQQSFSPSSRPYEGPMTLPSYSISTCVSDEDAMPAFAIIDIDDPQVEEYDDQTVSERIIDWSTFLSARSSDTLQNADCRLQEEDWIDSDSLGVSKCKRVQISHESTDKTLEFDDWSDGDDASFELPLNDSRTETHSSTGKLSCLLTASSGDRCIRDSQLNRKTPKAAWLGD